jgi:hypothetical protein
MGFRTPSLAPWKRLKCQVQSPSGVGSCATSIGQPLLGMSSLVMALAAIAPEGVVQPGGSDPAVKVIILDDDADTTRGVPPTAAAAISVAGVTGDIGSGDDMEPPADGEQPAPRMRGEAGKVFEPVGTSSCPTEALTSLEVERQPLPVSLLSLVRTEPEARHQDEPRQVLPGLLPSFILDDVEEQRR